MEKEIVLEVLFNLVGKVAPVGESREDEVRLENMEKLVWIFDKIHSKIDEIAYQYKDSPYASEKRIGLLADKCLRELAAFINIK